MLRPRAPRALQAGPLVLGLVLGSVLLGPASAHAATRDDVKAADGVFTGAVTGVHTSKGGATEADGSGGTGGSGGPGGPGGPGGSGGSGRTATYDVQVDRVYKGDVDTATVEVSMELTSRSCDVGPLRSGADYVFFVQRDGDALSADGCEGTDRASGTLVGKVEKMLGDGHPAVAPPPVHAELTRVDDAEPLSFARLAAPGAALVLVGLLGLVLVRRAGRRA